MLVINSKRITGKQTYRMVMDACKQMTHITGELYTKARFCRDAGINRMTIRELQRGKRPSGTILLKIAECLCEWGFEVSMEFKR